MSWVRFEAASSQVKSVSEGTWNRIYMSEDDESIASSISSMGGGLSAALQLADVPNCAVLGSPD